MRLVDRHEESLSGAKHQEVQHQGHQDAEISRVFGSQAKHNADHVRVFLLHPERDRDHGRENKYTVRGGLVLRIPPAAKARNGRTPN